MSISTEAEHIAVLFTPEKIETQNKDVDHTPNSPTPNKNKLVIWQEPVLHLTVAMHGFQQKLSIMKFPRKQQGKHNR